MACYWIGIETAPGMLKVLAEIHETEEPVAKLIYGIVTGQAAKRGLSGYVKLLRGDSCKPAVEKIPGSLVEIMAVDAQEALERASDFAQQLSGVSDALRETGLVVDVGKSLFPDVSPPSPN